MINVEYLFIRDKTCGTLVTSLSTYFQSTRVDLQTHDLLRPSVLPPSSLPASCHRVHHAYPTYRVFPDLPPLYTVFPEFVNSRSIIHIIISPFSSSFPLAGSAASHRFAMGSTDEDSIFLGSFPIAFGQEERKCTFVHCRPIGVGTQTK